MYQKFAKGEEKGHEEMGKMLIKAIIQILEDNDVDPEVIKKIVDLIK